MGAVIGQLLTFLPARLDQEGPLSMRRRFFPQHFGQAWRKAIRAARAGHHNGAVGARLHRNFARKGDRHELLQIHGRSILADIDNDIID